MYIELDSISALKMLNNSLLSRFVENVVVHVFGLISETTFKVNLIVVMKSGVH